jgi:arsenite transporter
VLGLLATVVLLFGFQGGVILDQPLLIALIAVPLLIQSYGIFALAYARPICGGCRSMWPRRAR